MNSRIQHRLAVGSFTDEEQEPLQRRVVRQAVAEPLPDKGDAFGVAFECLIKECEPTGAGRVGVIAIAEADRGEPLPGVRA